MTKRVFCGALCLAVLGLGLSGGSAAETIARPDGKPADMTKVAKALGEAATGKPPPAAAELPKDTNTIESLTPEQAKKLAAEFPGVEVEIKSRTGRKSTFRGALPLNGLKTIDALKRISQKTLTALTAKGNIEIPPTEKLELIPDEVK